MIKKQIRIIIISLVLIALLAVAFFVFIKPMLKEDDKSSYKELLMFPTIEKTDIKTLEVHNENGDFGFYQDDEGNFFLLDHAGTPYYDESFAALIVAARYPVAMSVVTEDMSKLSEYGLDEESNPAWYKITTLDGKSRKVFIGDLAPTGDRFYAMNEGGKKVFAVDENAAYFLRKPEAYVIPLLGYPIDSENYSMTERFTLTADDEVVVAVERMDEKDIEATASDSSYKMVAPESAVEAGYIPNTNNYEEILKTFIDFRGTETVKFYNIKDEVTPEELAEYGLDEPKYELYYRFNEIDNVIFFSDLQKDEETGETFYYAYSLMFNLVAKASPDTMKFLTWDFIYYVDRPLFHKNINNIEEISIEGGDVSETFTFSGEGENLKVTPKSTGKTFNETQLTYFRQLYVKLLYLSLEDYVEEPKTEKCVMTLTVKTKAGYEYEYKFYEYTTTHCYYTFNGNGDFYVLRNRIDKILSDTKTIMSGKEIGNELY